MKNLPVATILPSTVDLKDPDVLINESNNILKIYLNTTRNVPKANLKIRVLTNRELIPFKADFEENYKGDVSWDEYMTDEGYVLAPKTSQYGYYKNVKAAFYSYTPGGRFTNILPIKQGVTEYWREDTPENHPINKSLLRFNNSDWDNLFKIISSPVPLPTFVTAARIKDINWDMADSVAEVWLEHIYNKIKNLEGVSVGSTAKEIDETLKKLHEEDLFGFFDFDTLRDLVIYPNANGELHVSYDLQSFKALYKNLFSFATFAICSKTNIYQPKWLDYFGILEWNTGFKDIIDGFNPEDILVVCDCYSMKDTKNVFFFHQCLTRPNNVCFLPFIGDQLVDNYDANKRNSRLPTGP